jgi:hypothetical protein
MEIVDYAPLFISYPLKIAKESTLVESECLILVILTYG